MTANTDFDTAVLMARLKLHARKQLGISVDLAQLEADADYAAATLRTLEDEAEDETLLVLVVRLRAKLVKPSALTLQNIVSVALPKEDTPKESPRPPQFLRDHRFGARG